MAFAPLLLASASALQPAYPVDAMLSELQSICFTDYREIKRQGYSGTVSDTVDFWAETAGRLGWQEIGEAGDAPSSREQMVLHNTRSLNHAMFGSFGPAWAGRDSSPAMLGGQVFKKSISGRVVYLSIFGAVDDGGRSVAECRIHDPLGDGIRRNPLKARDVKKVAGAKLRRIPGPFSGDTYFWTKELGKISKVDIHFSFAGWRLTPFERKIQQFDPYAPYGLTLVAGFHSIEIVV